ncbi:MazG nucleotide pyrophosphohydrolase domain protein [compost metagenome]
MTDHPAALVSVPAAPAMTSTMTTHTTLRAANIARQIEWDQDNQISAAYRGNELAGEVGEACNVIKKLERERLGILGSRATVDELADELADVLICADLIAMHYGIDLEAAVVRKFNATSEKVGLRTRLAAPTDGGEA